VRGGEFGEASVFEAGLSLITPGGIIGQSWNVTPLVASDPTALILRDQRGEQEAEPQPVSPTPRRAKSNNWEDSLATAVKRGVSRGAVSVRPPAPAGKLANKLSSLSSGMQSGSRSATMTPLAAPSSDGLLASRRAANSNLSYVQISKDYRGAWRSGAAGSGGGTGGGSGGGFLQNGKSLQAPGSGISSGGTDVPGVDGSALSQQSSGAGSGPAKTGDADKHSLTSSKDDRNVTITQKEDLSYERRKMEMQKAIELKWAKKQYDQIERKKMLEQLAAQTASQALLKVLDALLKSSKGGDGGGEGGGG